MTDATAIHQTDDAVQCRMPVGFEHDQAPAQFMYMPAGVHKITAWRRGQPISLTVQVDQDTAAALNSSIQAHLANSPHKPFLDFSHEHKQASAWPTSFTWKPDGVYCTAEWSKEGSDAVTGKAYRGFSPEFFLDKYEASGAPSRVIGAPLCMGSLVNDPAFKSIAPLWAQDASSASAGELKVLATSAGEGGRPPGLSATGGAAAVTTITPIQIGLTMTEDKTAVAATNAAADNQNAIQAKDAEIVDLRAKLTAAESAVQAQRAKDADTAVKAAVARGAIPAKDEALQAKWKNKIIADPEFADVLASVQGSAAVQAGRITGSGIEITQEDPMHAVQAYSAERAMDRRGEIYAREFAPVIAKGGGLPWLPAFRRSLQGVDSVQAVNSFGTLVGNIISQRVLELLKYQLPALTRITTDFSSENVNYNQSVLTRYLAIPSVGTYNTSTGYPVISDATATDVTVTINQHKCVQLQLTANDLSGTARRLFDEQAPAMAYALAKDLVDAVYALTTAANFANKTVSDTVSFGRATVIDIAKALTDRGVPIGNQFRTLLLSTAYFAALAKDQAIVTLAAYQRPELITNNQLPDVHGFQIVEAPNLPTTGSLTGFAMSKSALVAATRLPMDYAAILPGASYGSVQTVMNPDTGAACMQTMYVDHNYGFANLRLAWMYGVAKGQANAGQRLASA